MKIVLPIAIGMLDYIEYVIGISSLCYHYRWAAPFVNELMLFMAAPQKNESSKCPCGNIFERYDLLFLQTKYCHKKRLWRINHNLPFIFLACCYAFTNKLSKALLKVELGHITFEANKELG